MAKMSKNERSKRTNYNYNLRALIRFRGCLCQEDSAASTNAMVPEDTRLASFWLLPPSHPLSM